MPWWFLAFAYDNYTPAPFGERIVVRSWATLDYTPGSASAGDRGQADLIHGEAGDDLILGEVGDDVLFGDGQDDTIIGGTGNDRIYGGAGDDGIIGDDGFFRTSRNGLAEPLWGATANIATTVALCDLCTVASLFPKGMLFREARLFAYPAVETAPGYADIAWGGLGNDWMHGNEGDDALSGAEALAFYYSAIPQDQILAAWGVDPTDPLGYDAGTRSFASFNVNDPRSKVYDCTDGTKGVGLDGTCPSGQKVEFLLAFTPFTETASGATVFDAKGQPVKRDDGCDVVFGDLGNDWLVGGTNTNWLFGGLGDDLLQTSQNLEVDAGRNQHPEPAAWADPVFAYGGAGRDVLIAATGRARLFDWTGDNDLFVVPFGWGGAPVVNRFYTPAIAAFVLALGKAGGADQSFTAPFDETGVTRPGGPLFGAQLGSSAIPPISIIAGQRMDFLGFVDLGGTCAAGACTAPSRAVPCICRPAPKPCLCKPKPCLCKPASCICKPKPCVFKPVTHYRVLVKPCPPPQAKPCPPVKKKSMKPCPPPKHKVAPRPKPKLPPCYALVPRNLRPLNPG